MITKNPMQLKAFIKNKAAEKHISAQLVMQNYMLERLLERISLSPYKNNFILKGGFLISAIVGLDTRATMDLDTTIKGFTLTHEAIRKIFTEICTVQIADDVQFEVVGISDIRETDDYPGIRVALKANYPPISVPLTVDVTTGDMITPREVEYTFSLLFDDRTISILAYNLETVLAEKLETVLSRNIANTRPRDYYDVHILYALRGAECDKATLRRALERTTQKRGSGMILTDYPEIMKEIRESDTLRKLWEKYSREYEYAKDISFDDTCNTMDIDDKAAVRIKKIGQYAVGQLRRNDLQKTCSAELAAHLEHTAILERKGGRRDKVLGGKPASGKPLPVKVEAFSIRVHDAVQHL